MMQRVRVNHGELECTVDGKGDAVLLIHGAHIADAFLPFTEMAALSEYSLIRYRRRGYGASTRAEGPPESYVSRASADAAKLLALLDVETAHVVGHSSGAIVALQLACERPALLKSLVLVEPPLLSVPSAAAHGEALGATATRYFSGDATGAVDDFMRLVGGSKWRELTAARVPGGAEQAVRDAATFFELELPAVAAWQCDIKKLKSFSQPVLFMRGAKTVQFHAEAGAVIHEWLPQTEDHVVEGAAHMVMLDNPHRAADGIAAFLKQMA